MELQGRTTHGVRKRLPRLVRSEQVCALNTFVIPTSDQREQGGIRFQENRWVPHFWPVLPEVGILIFTLSKSELEP